MPSPVRRAAIQATAVLLCTALAGCGDLPRPFAHSPDRPAAGLSRLVGGAGVAVLASGPAAQDHAVARDYAVALRALDVPADVAETPREGGYTLHPNDDGGWDLKGPGDRLLLVLPPGGDLATAAQRIAQAVEADALRPVTLRSAAAAAPVPTGNDSAAPPTASGPLPALRVAPVEGLEPARARVLAGAVEEALRRAGLEISPEAAWTVAGSFEAAPAAAGAPVPVRLVWRLIDPEGAESGAAQQVNAVPADMLERGFAPLALAIASGAAEGVAALAFQARQR